MYGDILIRYLRFTELVFQSVVIASSLCRQFLYSKLNFPLVNLYRDDSMTVAAVKKYLVNKLGLDNEDEVQAPDSEQSVLSLILSACRSVTPDFEKFADFLRQVRETTRI